MIYEPFASFLPAEYRMKYAVREWERKGAEELRRAVFCREQGVFQHHDRDAIDTVATPIVALSVVGGVPDEVVGTVRIHESEPGVWWGSRLAVADAYRSVGTLGSALIRLAVTSAHARGCRRFLAHVQRQNVVLFRRLHWRTLEEIDVHGRPHHVMEADLASYPPFRQPETGFIALPR